MLYRIKILKSEHKYVVTYDDEDSRIFSDAEFLNFISNSSSDDQWIIDEGTIPS